MKETNLEKLELKCILTESELRSAGKRLAEELEALADIK